MKKNINTLIPIMIIVLITGLTSCNLPFKIVQNVSTSPPVTEATTTPQPPTITTQPPETSLQTTPTPDNGVSLADLVPVTGSVLTWIDYSNFVYVPAGEFTMGKENILPDEFNPAHKVTLAGFWIHQAEVTNQQYARCVEAGVCSAPNKEKGYPYWYAQPDKTNAPVVGVTWSQAKQFCEYIEARLPTEAEWEKTARGTKDEFYPWGTDQPNCSLLNFNKCLKTPQPDKVRSYMAGASDYEALDLAGNVFEWVSDWYGEDYYTESPASNPPGPMEGIHKVYRGGGFLSSELDVSATSRFFIEPEKHSADLGFRCVLLGTYSDASKKSQVPRPCEVLPINDQQPKTQPTWTPFPCEPAFLQGNCYLSSAGGPITSIYVQQSNCVSNQLKDFSSSTIIDLNCSGPNIVGDSKTYTCNGKNMIQGSTADLSFCHKFSYQLMSPHCPAGYEYDSHSKFCLPSTGPWLPDPPCPVGYKEDSGVCLPDISVYQGCPVGFYSFLNMTGPNTYEELCLPLEDCLLPNATIPCEAPVCPAGQTYDNAKNCCSLPDKLKAVCPIGFGVQEDSNTQQLFCELPDLFPVECESRQVKIAYCPTITPSPTPTTVPPSNNCSIYGDEKSCEANGCTWGGISFAHCY